MKSEPGKGSHFWFDLTLPITNSQAENDDTKSEKKFDIISSLPLKNMDILVVEDNEVNRQVACELLTHAGAQIDLATGGIEGVMKVMQKMESHSTLYDLVIMDIQMPDIDGFEATRRIRADKRFKDLPILAMTANASESDRQACLAAGMNDHTGKPFDLAKLIQLIFQLTRKISNSSNSISQSTAANPVSSFVLLEDLNSLLSRYAGNFDLFKRFQKKFRPDIEKLLSSLNTALNENNLAAATSALHSIKGLSATLGAIALSRCASELEKSCKQQLVPKPQEIEKLAQLLIDSDIEMEKMANPERESPQIETKSSSLTVESELVAKLKLIAEHLKQSNMDAIHLFEQIQNQLPDSKMKIELVKNINNLEFAEAYSCLYKIIEDL